MHCSDIIKSARPHFVIDLNANVFTSNKPKYVNIGQLTDKSLGIAESLKPVSVNSSDLYLHLHLFYSIEWRLKKKGKKKKRKSLVQG